MFLMGREGEPEPNHVTTLTFQARRITPAPMPLLKACHKDKPRIGPERNGSHIG